MSKVLLSHYVNLEMNHTEKRYFGPLPYPAAQVHYFSVDGTPSSLSCSANMGGSRTGTQKATYPGQVFYDLTHVAGLEAARQKREHTKIYPLCLTI